MASEFPKLKKNLDVVLWEIEKTLQKKLASLGIDDEISLRLSEDSFVERSVVDKVAYSYRAILYGDKENDTANEGCFNPNGEIDLSKITEIHISAAQALLQLGRDHETAINVLTKSLLIAPSTNEKKAIRKAASAALSACTSQIKELDTNSVGTVLRFFDRQTIYVPSEGKYPTCDVQYDEFGGRADRCNGGNRSSYTKPYGSISWS